jgi:hypothetical protein
MEAPGKNPGCAGAKYSVSVLTELLTYGQQTAGGTYTPNASSFMVYNGTNTVVTFANVQYNPGGYACFDEQIDACYDQPIQIGFANPTHTGSFQVNRTIKTQK